jgi:hypothetical protein
MARWTPASVLSFATRLVVFVIPPIIAPTWLLATTERPAHENEHENSHGAHHDREKKKEKFIVLSP